MHYKPFFKIKCLISRCKIQSIYSLFNSLIFVIFNRECVVSVLAYCTIVLRFDSRHDKSDDKPASEIRAY